VTKTTSDLQRGLYAVSFETDQAAAGGNIVLDVGSGPMTVGYIPNTITVGASLGNTVQSNESGIAFLHGSRGVAIALILGTAAAGLGAFALGSLLVKQEDRLQSVLQPYTEVNPDAIEGNALAKSALFQRAVELTSNIAESQGLLVKAERMLEQANLPLRAAEALTFYVGIVFGSGILGFLFGRSLISALVLMVIGALAPPAVLNFLAKRRRTRFMKQLPDTLTLLAGTLKAGYSFMQGVEAVSHEVEEPMGAELRRIVTEAQLGRPLEEAMDASAERMSSPDFQWAVMAVRIQREVGGNLAELLITVAETMTARQRLRGEVAALTAEGKISAIVLGILPVGLGAVLFVINPEYMRVLFDDTLGQIMCAVACVSALIGFAWMKKIINIDI
jgi:tight adherence protein B